MAWLGSNSGGGQTRTPLAPRFYLLSSSFLAYLILAGPPRVPALPQVCALELGLGILGLGCLWVTVSLLLLVLLEPDLTGFAPLNRRELAYEAKVAPKKTDLRSAESNATAFNNDPAGFSEWRSHWVGQARQGRR